ncbi:uncharacterized protein LOC135397492 [Ornithodoros turicata]|uniref:uncharacterized protein LOC135397492 n=1 Tax=Ornithodoros turicata TaxID=34597 RepID=UPI0031388450
MPSRRTYKPKTVSVVKPKPDGSRPKTVNYYRGNYCLETNPFTILHTETYRNKTTKENMKLYYRCLGGEMDVVVCGKLTKNSTDLCTLYEKKCYKIFSERPGDIEGVLKRREKLKKCMGRYFLG